MAKEKEEWMDKAMYERDAANAYCAENAKLELEVDNLKKLVLDRDDLNMLIQLTKNKIASLDRDARNAAMVIIENSQEPGTERFKGAANDYWMFKDWYCKYENLYDRLTAISDNMNELEEAG